MVEWKSILGCEGTVWVLVAWELIYFVLFKISVWLIFWWVADYCKSNLGKQNLKYKCISWKYLIIDMNMNLPCWLLYTCRLPWIINAHCSVEAEGTVALTLAVVWSIVVLVANSRRRLFLLLCCLGTADHPFLHIASLPAPHPVHCGVGSGDGTQAAAAGVEPAMPDQKKKKKTQLFSLRSLILCAN